MKLTEFVNKFRSRYLWGNLIAMVVVCVLIAFGVKLGLDVYTHHGETIEVPDVRRMSLADARAALADMMLEVEVSDTGYVKEQPADCILEQSPAPGTLVKSGHRIALVVNASNTPTLTLPDIVDNCSAREATAKLKAMGFRLGQPQLVEGEKDWVYGILVDGRERSAGERIAIDKMVVILVGNGMLAEEDAVQYVDYHTAFDYSGGAEGDVDDFVEVP